MQILKYCGRHRFLPASFLPAVITLLIACNDTPGSSTSADSTTATRDPHSFARPDSVRVTHLDLQVNVDFDQREISGKARWTIKNLAKASQVVFDAKGLHIQKVTLGDNEAATTFSEGKELPFLGHALNIAIEPATTKLTIYYSTSPGAEALQWLNPQQTAGKKKPFLFTQSEPILARTWVPCQDGPGTRFTYNAIITVPADLLAVMSAGNPQVKNSTGIYEFKQIHAIPSYLLALAVGDLTFKGVDTRTGIYAEPSVIDKAAWEFTDMGKMVTAAEKLYGPYRWGRYDLLVLPPSFPYGGMENPNLTFATPTVIAGDRSLVSLVAHELAHSWSGNLVTNATWNDMWLNEGFTTYFERRIIEAVYGPEEAAMKDVLGRQSLAETVADFGDTSINTALKGHFEGRDPDENSSDIPYEKGCAFLKTIEKIVGRARFDTFVKGYFDKFAFQSRTTEQFLAYFNSHLIGGDQALAASIRAEDWIYKPGIPSNIAPATSVDFNKIDSLIIVWSQKGKALSLATSIKSSNELLYFISHLPANTNAAGMTVLDREFNFTNSGNAEVQCAWYTLAIRHHYTAADENIRKFLVTVGRRKFLKPLYKELISTPEGKLTAQEIYKIARPNYHPVAYGTFDPMLK